MPAYSGHGPLTRFERYGIWVWPLLAIGMGVMVELRSAFMDRRMTDFGCYARAAWAVRAGEDIYSITDDNSFHFAYPPACAVAFLPLADAPTGEARPWMLPYAVSVGIWYVMSIGFLVWGVHATAAALQSTSADPAVRTAPRYSRRWWYARTLPLMLCLAPIGCSLSRGQVNLLLVFMVMMTFAAWVRGHGFRAGLWLAAAVCLKFIPGFLLLFVLWRRDARSLAGVAAGLVVGVAIVPALAWGPGGAVAVHERMLEAILLPAVGRDADQARAKELMEMTATDNQSIQATLHNFLYPTKATRPPHADFGTKIAHLLITLALTTGSLLAAGWRKDADPTRTLILLGSLFLIMTIASPVSHTHYFVFAMPLMMGLIADSVARSGGFVGSVRSVAFLGLTGLMFALPMIPIWEMRREAGLPLLASLLLWGAGVRALRRGRHAAAVVMPRQPMPRQEALAVAS